MPLVAGAPIPTPTECVAVGRIRDAWGIAGWFRIDVYNAPRESVLRSVRRWWLRPQTSGSMVAGPRSGGETPTSALSVSHCRIHGDALVARAEGIDDRNAAESLKGFEVCVRRADFPQAGAGEYYWIDLIGCTVLGQGDARLGTVSALDDHGAHPILIVTEGEQERMVPFVEAYIVKVDLEARLIKIDWNADW